jgi:hypothetical protein
VALGLIAKGSARFPVGRGAPTTFLTTAAGAGGLSEVAGVAGIAREAGSPGPLGTAGVALVRESAGLGAEPFCSLRPTAFFIPPSTLGTGIL